MEQERREKREGRGVSRRGQEEGTEGDRRRGQEGARRGGRRGRRRGQREQEEAGQVNNSGI